VNGIAARGGVAIGNHTTAGRGGDALCRSESAGGRSEDGFEILGPRRDCRGGVGIEERERKDFTPSEAVAIKRAVEPLEKAAAKEKQLAAGERGKEGGRGKTKTLQANALKGKPAPQSRDKVAQATGMDARTLAKAEHVVAAAERDPEKYGKIITLLQGGVAALSPCSP
jgi:hypothetical protein